MDNTRAEESSILIDSRNNEQDFNRKLQGNHLKPITNKGELTIRA